MSKFRTKSKKKSVISTSSLPDIVFLLLFFFMMTATIRSNQDQQEIIEPKAHAITKVDQKNLIRELTIGKARDRRFGDQEIIMDKDGPIAIDDLVQWTLEQKNTLPEYQKPQMIVMIRADKHVKMGLISDIQEELRKANTRKVLYRSRDEPRP